MTSHSLFLSHRLPYPPNKGDKVRSCHFLRHLAKRYRVFSRLAFDLERDDAPVAAIATGASLDFFSARMGCQLYQPVYGIDIAALCVRR